MVFKRSSALQQGLIACTVGGALVAQLRVHQNPNDRVGWMLLIGMAVLALFVGWDRPSKTKPSAILVGHVTSKLWRLGWAAAAVLATAAATVLSARNQWPVVSVVLWLMACLIGGVAARDWTVSPPARATPRWSRWEVVAVIAIVSLGAAARVVWLDSIPRYYFADEARLGWSVVLSYRQAIPNFFTMGWNGWPWIGISLQGLFGPFLGITTTSLRMSSALMGTLALGTTYLLARELFTPRMAILATLLLALCRTAIDYSRLGVCLAQLMFLETLAFFWWWRAVNTGRALSYWWAGIGLGLCVLTYNAGDLVLLLWLGWLVLSVMLAPRSLRSYWRGALITAGGFLVAAYPWLDYITDHLTFGPTWAQWTIIARNRQIMSQVLSLWHTHGIGAAAAVLERQARLTWLGFGVLPEGGYGLGYRGGGMLDDVTAALFVIGLAMSIPRCWRPRDGFVLYWWIVTVIAGGVLTILPPAVTRLVGILPALALLAARPLDWLWRTAGGSRVRTAVAAVLGGLLVGGAAWANWQTYFVAFANAPFADPVAFANAPFASAVSAVGRRIEQLPRGSMAFLLGGDEWMNFFFELFHFNYPGRRLQDVPDPAQFLPLHRPVTFPLALILGPTQMTLAPYLHTLYPDSGIAEISFGPEQRPRFRELLLTPEDVAAQTGLQLAVYDRSDAVVARMTADPFAKTLAIPNTGTRLQWSGRIYWPTDRPVTLTVRANTPTEVRVADAPIARVEGAAASADLVLSLPRGWQTLTIVEAPTGERALSMAIKGPGATHAVTVWDLNPNPAQEGLTAVYEKGGRPVLRVIDAQLNVFAEEFIFPEGNDPMVRMPFSVSWTGALRIVTPGTYKFEAHGTGTYSVRLDGAQLVDAAHGSRLANQPERAASVQRTLIAGLHPLEAHWDCPKPAQGTRRLFQLYWTPPDGERTLIPPPSFVPAMAGSN